MVCEIVMLKRRRELGRQVDDLRGSAMDIIYVARIRYRPIVESFQIEPVTPICSTARGEDFLPYTHSIASRPMKHVVPPLHLALAVLLSKGGYTLPRPHAWFVTRSGTAVKKRECALTTIAPQPTVFKVRPPIPSCTSYADPLRDAIMSQNATN